jgi:hypothetical protein
MLLNRTRIRDELIELLCEKLLNLPTPHDVEPDHDYESTRLMPDITDNELDLAEVAMDIEDAFGIAFEDNHLPGGRDLETIGKIIDYIAQSLKERWPDDVEAM